MSTQLALAYEPAPLPVRRIDATPEAIRDAQKPATVAVLLRLMRGPATTTGCTPASVAQLAPSCSPADRGRGWRRAMSVPISIHFENVVKILPYGDGVALLVRESADVVRLDGATLRACLDVLLKAGRFGPRFSEEELARLIAPATTAVDGGR